MNDIKIKELVFIIQPIESANYLELFNEAISLIESVGAEYVGCIFQNIKEINPATYIGEGKLAELYVQICDMYVTVLFNGNLSPSQTLNISAGLNGKKVIDRTTLILDIFAQRAKSSEGKMQVELAQLKYIYPRLKGKGEALSRLGGGIGTRGPGETQLETDRRHIRSRIHSLENAIKQTEQRRKLQVERRKKDNVKTIALVGYTNTGKSTLLNKLTGADVFTKNLLFATLDPTARLLEIEGVEFILVDTVGFLQNLPHQLIDAFHSTLESALNCDLALIVCDASTNYQTQLETTLSTLKELKFQSPYLIVMNKCDLVENLEILPHNCIEISAVNGKGLEQLKNKIFEQFRDQFIKATLYVPYEKFSEYNKLKGYITQNAVNYLDDGIKIQAIIPTIYSEKFKQFLK